MLHFKFQQSTVSSFDKKRGASNASRVEEGICFPFVKYKSVENIFLMFEKTKQNEAHSKTNEFILIRNNMKNTTVESVQLELNRNCFIT